MSIETRVTASGTVPPAALPHRFIEWFASKGWAARPHQLELLGRAQAGRSSLLIAPTGAGKTLAGFLPSLVELADREPAQPGVFRGIHTLYVSPLKALAVDILRNLETPIAEMGLKVTSETRTGDTPVHKRTRQKDRPPDILLTTPEQVALLIASDHAERFFKDLRYVVFDELHSLVVNKRGHLLSLGLARLRAHSPTLQTIGLSATVSDPDALREWLVPQNANANVDGLSDGAKSDLVTVEGGAKPDIAILETTNRLPWQGHSMRYAVPEMYELIKAHKTTLLFVNTRSQAELLFRELWNINEDALPIALHHGSLEPAQRRKVEAAMGRGELRGVIATSTLDLGIDWGDVDLVLHAGAPKGASRLAQRIGRANHRMDEPSKAILIPANRFEVMECQAALDANYLGSQDTPPLREGALDVLCQHVLGRAVAGPFDEDAFYAEVISAAPYARLDWDTFERAIHFVATGGYALKVYERYAKIKRTNDGTWRLTHPRFAQAYRMNCGTIYEPPSLAVRVTSGKKLPSGMPKRAGRVVGKLDEFFLEQLTPGDTFMFAGQTLRFEGIRDQEAFCSPADTEDPRVPMYAGSQFPLTTHLASHIRAMMANPNEWGRLPAQVQEWLRIQELRSVVPKSDEMLVETFPNGRLHFMVVYSFEGRLAHQTLGMLISKRLDRIGARPTGFIATDYVMCFYMVGDLGQMIADGQTSMAELFDEDMMGEDLDDWMQDSFMLKRTFRWCAIIAGLIERNSPGREKSGRQMTASSDLIYDVLREHEPDHIVLQATYQDAATGLLDVRRAGELLGRIKGHIRHVDLDRISPLAVPIMLEKGRNRVESGDDNELLMEAAENLIAEAMTV